MVHQNVIIGTAVKCQFENQIAAVDKQVIVSTARKTQVNNPMTVVHQNVIVGTSAERQIADRRTVVYENIMAVVTTEIQKIQTRGVVQQRVIIQSTDECHTGETRCVVLEGIDAVPAIKKNSRGCRSRPGTTHDQSVIAGLTTDSYSIVARKFQNTDRISVADQNVVVRTAAEDKS